MDSCQDLGALLKHNIAASVIAALVTLGMITSVGSATAAVPAAAIPSPCGPIAPGSTGSCVEALQEAFGKIGVTVEIDGVYGDQTRAAVNALQDRHKITPRDGVVWGPTREALEQEVVAPRTPAASNPAVVSAAKPDKDAYYLDNGLGTMTCSKIPVVGTCSIYLSRSKSKALNDAVGTDGAGLSIGLAEIAACAKASGSAALLCGVVVLYGDVAVKGKLRDAAADNKCVRFRFYQDEQSTPRGVYVDNSRNCID